MVITELLCRTHDSKLTRTNRTGDPRGKISHMLLCYSVVKAFVGFNAVV